jgi:hypothetical protein
MISNITMETNVEILVRERGKLIDRRESHNIFVDVGRTWLAQYIGGQVTTYINQMGLGIGGTKQNSALADLPPLTTYPVVGAKSQTDTDVLVTTLERPICVSSASHPIAPGQDLWLKVMAPPDHPTPSRSRFTGIFTEQEVNFWQFSTVPISELGLFLSDKDPHIRTNQLVLYDTIDPIHKTTAITLEVRWTIIL